MFPKHPALERFTPEELQAIVENATKQPSPLKEMQERLVAEVEAKLRADGVPEVIILLMRSVQQERAARRELMKDLFPIQQMPEGAQPIYFKDPEVAALVTTGEDGSERTG